MHEPRRGSPGMSVPVDPAVPVLVGEARRAEGPLSRRGFLRGAAVAGGGLAAVTLAACTPALPTASWTYGPTLNPNGSVPPQPTPAGSAGASPAPSTGPAA